MKANMIAEEETDGDVRFTPLVIDLDGTLIRSDLLVETAFAVAGSSFSGCVEIVRQLFRGKAQLKKFLAHANISLALLPYDPLVLARAKAAANAGQPVYLASASDEKLVRAIAEHLGFFSGWFASDGTTNLAGATKAGRLVDVFGRGGFDYIGNGAADIPVWAVCRKRIAIRAPSQVRSRLLCLDPETEFLSHERPTWQVWARLLRVHQYSKNVLVLVPLLTSHEFTAAAVFGAVGGMISFSLCASGVYIINDLIDLEADRLHPTKRERPLASGAIPLAYAVFLSPVLIASAMLLAALISPTFLLVLACYLGLTTAYTFSLKRRAIVDVVVLAMLYTLRVIAGGEAIDLSVSEWLLGFSMFMFMSLALIKRYVELSQNKKLSLPDPTNRNYNTGDMNIIGSLAAASAFNAITLFSLYLSSDTVHRLYRHPQFLWLICPLLMYWSSRALMVAHRDAMHDDPVVFALKDRTSRMIAIAMVVIVFIAI
jgi:4-hydroxybenzoate polyprenyltransferase/phosphoserine phosphatase